VAVAELIRSARREAGLTQRQLAALAGTSAAAICFYEQAERVPRVDTAARILEAAGRRLVLVAEAPPRIDVRANAEAFEQVLGLADALPQRHAEQLAGPVFASLAVGRSA